MASATQVGTAGLEGWREKVGDAVADPVAQRTPLAAARGGAGPAFSLGDPGRAESGIAANGVGELVDLHHRGRGHG